MSSGFSFKNLSKPRVRHRRALSNCNIQYDNTHTILYHVRLDLQNDIAQRRNTSLRLDAHFVFWVNFMGHVSSSSGHTLSAGFDKRIEEKRCILRLMQILLPTRMCKNILFGAKRWLISEVRWQQIRASFPAQYPLPFRSRCPMPSMSMSSYALKCHSASDSIFMILDAFQGCIRCNARLVYFDDRSKVKRQRCYQETIRFFYAKWPFQQVRPRQSSTCDLRRDAGII